MTKEKQIEEMAKVMHDGCAIVRATNRCRGEDCLDCAAITCYEKGYRKASEVAREIIRILRAAGINKFRYPVVAEIEKKYTEGEG